MFRRIGSAVAVLFLALAGLSMTAGTSQAANLVGGHYGSATTCYNAINGSSSLKARGSFCGWAGTFYAIWASDGDTAYGYFGGAYGSLNNCYNAIVGNNTLKTSQAFCTTNQGHYSIMLSIY
jgi:hypothetical protein